jgi:hypothetical protein
MTIPPLCYGLVILAILGVGVLFVAGLFGGSMRDEAQEGEERYE